MDMISAAAVTFLKDLNIIVLLCVRRFYSSINICRTRRRMKKSITK